jgi:hypothetical protein
MSYRRPYRKEAEAFLAQGCAMLLGLGATHLRSRERVTGSLPLCASSDFELQTVHGRLELHVFDAWIATRFEGLPALAGPSGKWNHYYTFSTPKDLLALPAWMDELGCRIRAILPDVPVTPAAPAPELAAQGELSLG